jgi:TRAP-type uncharacterized transport system substrate-binding protein
MSKEYRQQHIDYFLCIYESRRAYIADANNRWLNRRALGESLMNATAPKVDMILGMAEYGGGSPLLGNVAEETLNEIDRSLSVIPRNRTGSTENIGILDASKLDIAPAAAEPAYKILAGVDRGKSDLKIASAIQSGFGMIAVRDASTARLIGDHVGKTIAWGALTLGVTLLRRFVIDGLDRGKDSQPFYLDKTGNGPMMVADWSVNALCCAGVGRPDSTTVFNAGGRFVELNQDEVVCITSKHNFREPITVPSDAYGGKKMANQTCWFMEPYPGPSRA